MNLAAEVILEARIDSLERENATLRAQLAAYQTATTIPAPPLVGTDDDLPSPREAMTGARE